MPRRIALATAALFLAHLAWAIRIGFGPTPLTEGGQILVAADLVLLGVVSTIAVLLGRTPWTRRLALGSLALHGVSALALEVNGLWIAAACATFVSASGLAPMPSGQWFSSPPGQAVPTTATALALGLAALPMAIGLTAYDGVTPLGVATAAIGVVTAFVYSRASLSGLWFARIAIPLLVAGSAIGLVLPAAIALVLAGAVLAWLAWTGDARNAASPLARRQTTVPVLPEMVPADILEAAGFDTRGRPKDDR